MVPQVETEYPLPYHSEEDKRLKIQHTCLRLVAGGNLLKPVKESLVAASGPLKFLDVGGGSGIWGAEVAVEHPMSQVVVMDIRDQSQNVKFPPNCTFVQGDMTKSPLPFESNTFDCVQIRICWPVTERETLYKEVNRILKPGGFIQLVDILDVLLEMEASNDNPGSLPGPPTVFRKLNEAGAALFPKGRTSDEKIWTLDPYVPGPLENAVSPDTGRPLWESVQHGRLVLPISAWPSDEKEREIGRMMTEEIQMLLEGLRSSFVEKGILSEEACVEMRNEFRQILYTEPLPRGSRVYTTHLARKADT